jgi:hypothetical protein
MRIGRTGKALLAVIVAAALAGCSEPTATPSASPSGLATASLEASVAPTPTIYEGGILSVASYTFLNETGAVEVVIQVKNVSPRPARIGGKKKPTFEIVNHDGFTLALGDLWMGPQYLPAGATGYLGGWTTDMTAAMIATIDHVTPKLAAEQVASIPSSLAIDGKFSVQADGANRWLTATGTVKNNGSSSVASGVVVVFLLDSAGKPIGWLGNDHTLPGLGTGISVPVTVTSPQVPASLAAKTKTVMAYAYELESPQPSPSA